MDAPSQVHMLWTIIVISNAIVFNPSDGFCKIDFDSLIEIEVKPTHTLESSMAY
jgi:hypothetical protein